MALRLIEVVASEGHSGTILAAAEKCGAIQSWRCAASDADLAVIRILLNANAVQSLFDVLQATLGSDAKARAVLEPVLATLPHTEDEAEEPQGVKSEAASREELYNTVSEGLAVDPIFVVLVFLSTLVAAIGMVRDNVAVVIGAMVIAPLLGPNLAFALGVTLGDHRLMLRALRVSAVGFALAIGASTLAGVLIPLDLASHELVARTQVTYDSIALALASGAAAVLSLTTGLSAALVGVMVAVALLPPAATFGLMLGAGRMVPAAGAATLLAVNLVCIVLAAQIVFLIQGVKPRTWWQKKDAQQSTTLSIVLSSVLLIVLAVLIYFEGLPIRP